MKLQLNALTATTWCNQRCRRRRAGFTKSAPSLDGAATADPSRPGRDAISPTWL